MSKILDYKISYYGRNKRVLLNNPRYQSLSRVKTKPNFKQQIKNVCDQFVATWGPYMMVNDPMRYQAMTGKKVKLPSTACPVAEKVEEQTTSAADELTVYQTTKAAERKLELEKAIAAKNISSFVEHKPRTDWSRYGRWVNAYEPINKGKIGSAYGWKEDKKNEKKYY